MIATRNFAITGKSYELWAPDQDGNLSKRTAHADKKLIVAQAKGLANKLGECLVIECTKRLNRRIVAKDAK